MFESLDQGTESDLSIPAKIIAGSAVGLVLSFGLCGMQAFLGFSFLVGMAGLICLVLSVLGLVVGLLWLLVAFVGNMVRR